MDTITTSFAGMDVDVHDEGVCNIRLNLNRTLGETSTKKSWIVGNTSGWKQFSTPSGVYKINCLIIKMK